MTVTSAICLAVALLIPAITLIRREDLLSPGRIFTIVWALAIGLADLKLSRFQGDWSAYAWVSMLCPIAAFLLGAMVINVLTVLQPVHSVERIRERLLLESVNERTLFLLLIFLFGGYSIAYIIEWINYGTLPLIAANPDAARSGIPLFGFHLLVNLMPAILLMCVEYFSFVSGQRLRKIVVAGVFLLVFLSYFFFLNRLPYVLFAIMAIGTLYYSTNVLRARWLFPVVLVLSASMRYLQSVRELRYVSGYFYVVSRMRYSSEFAEFTVPYMYVVMNLENFARAVGKVEAFGLGYFTFDFLTALVGLKHPLASYFGLDRLQFLNSGYNTFPFFWDYYLDFGFLGVAILPLLLGAASMIVYQRLRSAPSLKLAVYYSIVVYVIILSFFANMLGILNIMVNVGVLCVFQPMISADRSRR